MRAAFVAGILAAALTASSAVSSPGRWTWKSLHRPLHVPQIAGGTACPVSSKTTVDLGAEGSRSLPGRGPAYPNIVGGATTLDFVYPPDPRQTDFYGTDWGGNKVLWWIAGTYHGPVLIRGRQVDGPNLVRFDRGRPLPQKEIRIAPGRGYAPWKGARDRASFTRLKAAGCYAYQIDGTTFSRVIVFEARIAPPPPG